MNFTKRYIIKPGSEVKLNKIDPGDTAGLKDKKAAKKMLKQNTKQLTELQYQLYAEHKHAVLIVLQALDAAGKDGTIRHVMGDINPQGCRVWPFKAPTSEERDHDFLWRVHKRVPGKGMIGIFNRSHYEDVLVVRVHDLVPRKVWSKRYDHINDFEDLLAANGVTILKFFLHISKDEQLQRFQDRMDEPDKHWKLSEGDFKERGYWDKYMKAYEAVLSKCSKKKAPWFVIPANNKWFRNLAVSEIIRETLENLQMEYPEPHVDVEELKKLLK